jgi:hypothetical protein
MDTTTTFKLPAFSNRPTLTDSDPRSPANIARRQTLRLAERDEQGRLLPGSVLERAGRPAGHTVQFMARQYTSEAITCLAGVMEDERAPPAARCTAAMALLDRGWGKSPISIGLSARTNFADFLRDVGVGARWEHDHPDEVGLID